MARTVTWDDVRTLAGVEATTGCAISLYLNLDPSVAPTPGEAQTHVRSLLDEAAKSHEATRDDLSHDARQALRADFERIQRFFEQEFVRDGAHGVAVFCGSLDGIWVARGLIHPVPDRVSVGRRLLVAPLAALVGQGDGAVVAVVSREQGRFYRLADGRLEELADLSDRQPRRHDQGGWSQANRQRHIDGLAADHLREVAEEVDRRVREAPGALQVVIAAPEESRAELGDLLSQESRHAFAGWVQAEAHAGPAELLELAAPVLAHARAERERALLERWREEAGRDGRAAMGWEATLEAVSDARVETLLVSPTAERDAWRCPSCGRLQASGGACPLDGRALEEAPSGVDAAVHAAVANGGTVWMTEAAQDLDPVGGIGALLRF